MKPISIPDIRKQVTVLESAESFFESAVLFALFELGVFRAIADGPRSLAELSSAVGGNPETLRAVLDAGVALEILTREDECYGAEGSLLDCLGREAAPAYLGEWVSFLHALAPSLFQLHEAVRTGTPPAALFEEMSGDTLPARRMTRAMDAYARSRGIEIAQRLDFSTTRTLLDVGCGPGTYSFAIVSRFPNVRATLLDLPGPIEEARRHARAMGMEGRVEFVTADASSYVADRTYDAVLISNTLHMLGPAASMRLLARCRDMLSPGGRIIVQAQYLNDDRTSPRWPTLLNLIQRVATPEGRNHSLGETTDWLHQAGFTEVEHVRLSLWNVCSCLIGHCKKP